MPDDLVLDRNRRHHTDDEYSPLKSGRAFKDHHLENRTKSRLLSTCYLMLHLVCLLLGVSLFFDVTATSRDHRDLAMLGT